MPNNRTSLWSRIRKGRLVQVLAVYIGVSWVLIQVTDALMNALSLPHWVGPVVVILLMVGLLVVLATAWVQSNPLVADRAEAEEVPRAWAVDVREMGRSVRHGRLPHLTWGRALTGGLVAFSLLFGLAGVYVLAGGRSPGATPLAATAGAAPGVAVLPFDARGVDDELFGAGMVDLLATNLDGVAGLRSIDSRTVLARWREARAESAGDLGSILRVAGSTGARWAVVGSAAGVGTRVRVTARLYDVETGVEHGRAQAEGDPAEILSLVDALSIDLVRELIREGRLPQVTPRSLAAITTSSVPALRAYLQGEVASRRADFRAAMDAYDEALAADSSFALAAHRAGIAAGWVENRGSERTVRYRAIADAHNARLPARDAALLRAFNQALDDGDPAGIEALEQLAQRYPDDPEIWTMMGEARFHLGPQVLIPPSSALEAFEQAIALDSAYAPAYIHPVEVKLATARDPVGTGNLLAAYERYGAVDQVRIQAMRIAFVLMHGAEADLPPAEGLDEQTLAYAMGTLSRGGTGSVTAIPGLLRLMLAAPNPPFPEPRIRAQEAMFHLLLGRTGPFLERWPRMPRNVRAGAVLTLHEYGMTLPEELVRDILAADAAASDDAITTMIVGVIATMRDDHTARATALARLRALAREDAPAAEAAGPTAEVAEPAEVAASAAEALEALDHWREGRLDRAFDELERIRMATIGYGPKEGLNEMTRVWLGQLEAERGHHESAIRYLASVIYSLPAMLLHAESLEALGRNDAARDAYAELLRIWADPDPDFPPADRARRGLARLAAEG
jgi:tetratricopeptide (TPR) repeat protein